MEAVTPLDQQAMRDMIVHDESTKYDESQEMGQKLVEAVIGDESQCVRASNIIEDSIKQWICKYLFQDTATWSATMHATLCFLLPCTSLLNIPAKIPSYVTKRPAMAHTVCRSMAPPDEK